MDRLAVCGSSQWPWVAPGHFDRQPAHQVQQELGQQPNNVGSTSRVKPPRVLWTEDLHRKFLDVIDANGGPWAVKPRHIWKEMAHFGISHCQIKNRLQEQLKNVDGGKADDNVYVPQLLTEADMIEAHISPDNAFIEELLNWT
ncbi:transcription factor HHO6-like [Solanum lycopersicum]|uniref:transcription factor HHO6-like n=1 Tax=Solanum lycopersicum TaxID=4081 RepID=UPI000E1CAD3B|nr:transcription factor HHO6-like [Solanum lycopersicum]